jgi:hypothetical protein
MRPRRRSPRSAPPSESAIYDGAVCLGSIFGRGGSFKAVNAAGRKLGNFKTAQLAMQCIVSAARERVG